jgi:hypothetical protein
VVSRASPGAPRHPAGAAAPPPGDHRTPSGARRYPPGVSPTRGITAPPRRSDWRVGFSTAGTWRGCVRVSADRPGRANLHHTAIERDRAGLAVLRVPHMRSTARPHRIGSVVELCMPAAPRPVPGTTAPTLRRPPLSRGRRRTAPEETSTPPQMPAVIPRMPLQRPGVPPHPPPGARRYPLGVQTRTEERDHPGRARTPGGTGIAATARSASLPRLTGLPQFHPEDVERSETQISRRPTNTPRRAAPAGR